MTGVWFGANLDVQPLSMSMSMLYKAESISTKQDARCAKVSGRITIRLHPCLYRYTNGGVL